MMNLILVIPDSFAIEANIGREGGRERGRERGEGGREGGREGKRGEGFKVLKTVHIHVLGIL